MKPSQLLDSKSMHLTSDNELLSRYAKSVVDYLADNGDRWDLPVKPNTLVDLAELAEIELDKLRPMMERIFTRVGPNYVVSSRFIEFIHYVQPAD